MIPPRLAPNVALGLAVLLPAAFPVQAQDSTLQGTCQALVIADQDVTASCKGSLLRLVSPTFASFAFSTGDGRTLSFIGGGIKDANDPSELPVTLVASGLSTKEGVSRSTTPGSGACRISHPDPDGTAVACEASAQGKRYTGSFLARGKSEAGAAKL